MQNGLKMTLCGIKVDASGATPLHRVIRNDNIGLTQSVCKVVWQKSIFIQIRQLILYMSYSKGQVDGFVG